MFYIGDQTVAEQALGQTPDLIVLAGDIVAAYVSNNAVPVTQLPELITSIYNAMTTLSSESGDQTVIPRATTEKPSAAEIRRSVHPDGIVSFIDGKSYKTLKRHLTAHGLHPASYRARYGLPADYPMVASAYAERRSDIARSFGLGRPGAMAEVQPRRQKVA